jgi:cytochrome P450
MVQWLTDPGGTMTSLYRRYGDIITFRNPIFGTQVLVTRPATLKQVFTAEAGTYRVGRGNRALAPIIGPRSVMLLNGPEHLRQRRLLLPGFHGERMHRYIDAMREATLRTVETWRVGDTLSLRPQMQRIALDIILDAVLGIDDRAEADRLHDAFTDLMNRVQSPFGALWLVPALQRDLGPLTGYAAAKRARERVHTLVHEHIARHRARTHSGRDDVLRMMLEAVDESGVPMTDDELRDELMTLLIAGHETTVTSGCWAFEEILRIEGEQQRLADEVMTASGGLPIRGEHLPQLERLDSVVKETLRLWPVFGATEREIVKPVNLQGHDLEPGITVAPCAFLTHRRPDLYPEPERFIPDRFVGKKTDPYEWLPFGGGIRRCIGMSFSMHEMKTILSTILAAVSLELEDARPAKMTLKSFFLVPKGGTRVRILKKEPTARRAAPHGRDGSHGASSSSFPSKVSSCPRN